MNLAYRSKFKNITKIENKGRTLKGEELFITLCTGKTIKVFGDTQCITINRFGEEEDIRAKDLTTDLALKMDQFVDQL
jgi:hypothetical protein